MNSGKYILVDGSFVILDDYRISLHESECLRISETFRSVRTTIPFFRETLELLKLKLMIYNQSIPEFTENDGAGLLRQLGRTLTKNKHFMGASLTVIFWFDQQQVHYIIQSEKLEETDYAFNEKGLFLEVFDKIQKPVSALSNLTIGSEIFWKIAQSQKNFQADEQLILNSDDQIVETPYSNIYLFNGKSVRTSGEIHGAYMDVTRPIMRKIFDRLNLSYDDSEGITLSHLEDAEEIMLVNPIDGVRWVAGFEGKRYFNNNIRKICRLFGQLTIN